MWDFNYKNGSTIIRFPRSLKQHIDIFLGKLHHSVNKTIYLALTANAKFD